MINPDVQKRALTQFTQDRVLQQFGFLDSCQRSLGFDDDHKRQLEADLKSWGNRLQQFERDLASEPRWVHEFYRVCAKRIEPVGLVYLWPETN